ncbi:MAG: hypothetical protein C4519_01810 [Desulfobacteraceae bacterium]|nr:MAG: hypothetical protein C4519_01810 [Desulfobacteraceae bacterium]
MPQRSKIGAELLLVDAQLDANSVPGPRPFVPIRTMDLPLKIHPRAADTMLLRSVVSIQAKRVLAKL